MVLLWRRSQQAAQYVCNVLDAGNVKLAALSKDSRPTFAPKMSQPTAAPQTDPATAFWLSGHEVKDLLTVHVAVSPETGALLECRRAVVHAAAASGAVQKRKHGAVSSSSAAAKRRRAADDGIAEFSARQQTYISEMLMYVTLGEDTVMSGGDGLPAGGLPDLPPAAAGGQHLDVPQATLAHAQHAAQLVVGGSSQLPSAGSQAVVSEDMAEAGRTLPKPLRDRWTQVSIQALSCGSLAFE